MHSHIRCHFLCKCFSVVVMFHISMSVLLSKLETTPEFGLAVSSRPFCSTLYGLK